MAFEDIAQYAPVATLVVALAVLGVAIAALAVSCRQTRRIDRQETVVHSMADAVAAQLRYAADVQAMQLSATNDALGHLQESLDRVDLRVAQGLNDTRTLLDAVRETVDTRLRGTLQAQSNDLATRLGQFDARFAGFQQTVNQSLKDNVDTIAANLRYGTETMTASLNRSTDASSKALGEVRATVERQLTQLRADNNAQLDTMRQTVDEKLQKTLDARMAHSFKQVSEQLEQVYKGLGEMQGLAQGVGDLKRVLSNVKTRGILGEVQLGAILKDILAPEQYAENVATVPGSSERVEFAVKMPGEEGSYVYLPIDSKLPGDAYAHVRDAANAGDPEALERAWKQLETTIKNEAKDIATKYLEPPATTSFGIMFLPFEGLYAEVVDRPGLLETLQRDYRVNVAGPSTMAALLNSLQMGFQTVAIQRHADEIQNVLRAVKKEFGTYQGMLQRAHKQIMTAGNTLEDLVGRRARAMERKLRQVTELDSAEEAERVLGIEAAVGLPEPLLPDDADDGGDARDEG